MQHKKYFDKEIKKKNKQNNWKKYLFINAGQVYMFFNYFFPQIHVDDLLVWHYTCNS